MKYLKSLLLLICSTGFLFGTSACKNVFEEASSKTTDDAYLYAASLYADRKEWTAAIDSLQLMTPEGQSKRENRVTLASYYGGRCGLEILGLALDIADGITNTKLLPLLMKSMKGKTGGNFTDCKQAETILTSVGATPADRTPNENVLLAFVEFAKIGVTLASSNADPDHNGILDGATVFNSCATNDISDLMVGEMGTGIFIGSLSLAASGSTAAADAISSIATMCTAIEAQPGAAGICAKTDPTQFGALEIQALRALIKSIEIGFGRCGGAIGSYGPGTSDDCVCPVVNDT